MVRVSDTSAPLVGFPFLLGCFAVVAMSMEQLEIHQPVIAAQALRDDVVNFPNVPISKVESTGSTPPAL